MSSPPLRVLIGLTGSVASIKGEELVESLVSSGCHVKVIATSSALHFTQPSSYPSISSPPPSLSHPPEYIPDSAEWESWSEIGDDVVHIELRKWADVYLIAPLDANSLAKLATGLADNLVTCVARAWEFTPFPGEDDVFEAAKPVAVAPAMNTAMWNHPVTKTHCDVLERWGYGVIPPVAKTLACGDTGVGAMAKVDDLVAAVLTFRPQ